MVDPQKLTIGTLTKAQARKLQKLSSSQETSATIGVLAVMLATVIAVRFPAYYWVWHMLRTFFHLPLRYIRFKKRKYQLFMLDWCYIVTYTSNICCTIAFLRYTYGIHTPLEAYNTMLIRGAFSMASGPLAWAVHIFKNSLVFHDPDSSASIFIHLSPFILVWCLRWGAGLGPGAVYNKFPEMFRVCDSAEDYSAADECLSSFGGWLWCDACTASPSAFIVFPFVVYVVIWWIPYFLFVLVLWRDWIEETGHKTLYTHFCETQPDLVRRVEKKLQGLVGKQHAGPLGYMLSHMIMVVSFGSMSYIFWHSFLLHTLFFGFILVTAIHNGSSFMFRIFAYRHAEQQLQIHASALE